MNSAPSQLQAADLALTGYTFWVLADTCLKIVGASRLPAYEIIAGVGVAVCAVLGTHAMLRGGVRTLLPRNLQHQVLRSLLDLANNFCVILALRHLPLALFYILIFLSPTVTILLAALSLGESLQWKKALAILAGFVGVIIAVDPAGHTRPGDWVGYLACIVCVTRFSTNMAWSRRITQTETPASLTFFSGLVMAIAGSAAMLLHALPLPTRTVLVLLATGVFCVLGSTCFFLALKHTSAANVSQYQYTQLPIGAFIGFLIWHEKLSQPMLYDAALIVAAGAYSAASTHTAPL